MTHEFVVGSKVPTMTPKTPGDAPAARQPWELYLLVGGLIVQCTLILLGNQPAVATWLLAFLTLAVGQGLLLPAPASWFGGLAVVVLWVFFRQTIGLWTEALWGQSFAEIGGLLFNVIVAVLYRQGWRRQQQELQELRALHTLLIVDEDTTGLLPFKVAGLRLREEVDRARLFQRPLGLLLLKVDCCFPALPQPTEPTTMDATEIDTVEIDTVEIDTVEIDTVEIDTAEIDQGIARQLATLSGVHDIPFRARNHHFGVILPERDAQRLYADAETIRQALQAATFLDCAGHTQSVTDHATLYFGLGAYQGEGGEVDLLGAALDSLTISRTLSENSTGTGPLHAMPATAIALATPPGEPVAVERVAVEAVADDKGSA